GDIGQKLALALGVQASPCSVSSLRLVFAPLRLVAMSRSNYWKSCAKHGGDTVGRESDADTDSCCHCCGCLAGSGNRIKLPDFTRIRGVANLRKQLPRGKSRAARRRIGGAYPPRLSLASFRIRPWRGGPAKGARAGTRAATPASRRPAQPRNYGTREDPREDG